MTRTKKTVGRFIRFTLTIMFAIQSINARGDIIVHDTFSDNDIEDGLPAVWEYSNVGPHGPSCGASIFVDGGDAEVDFCGFAMYSLASVNDVEIEPDNNLSIRARITGQATSSSLPGVGIDSYYWAAAMYQPQFDPVDAPLAFGNPFDGDTGNRAHNFFETWVIQLDVFPDRLEAYRWPADDPGNVSQGTWSNRLPIKPGRPVFWGNWGGKPIFHEVVVADSPMGVGGDFDRSGALDVSDIDSLNAAIRIGENDPRYNLTNDEIVDVHDRDVWVKQVANTYYGDANLNGEFDSGDLVAVFAINKYELDVDAGWGEGDWNGDLRFESGDLITAFQDNGYEKGPRSNAAIVPEPAHGAAILGLCLLVCRGRSRQLIPSGPSAAIVNRAHT